MTTLRVGIASKEDFKKMTMDIANGGYKPGVEPPKVCFSSIEIFAKILSDKNRKLLAIIAEINPDSLTELAELTGREKSNLSRTLKTMERYGLIEYTKGEGKARAPRAIYSDVVLDVSLTKPQMTL